MNMTTSFVDLAFYALAVLILFLTPGPVWIALKGIFVLCRAKKKAEKTVIRENAGNPIAK